MILTSRFYLPLFVLLFLFPSTCISASSARDEILRLTDAGDYGFNFQNPSFHRLAANKVYFEAKNRLATGHSAQAAVVDAAEEAESGVLEDAMAHLKTVAASQQSISVVETPVGIRILDVGCGDGSFARSLLKLYPESGDFPIHYTGADIREGYGFIRDIEKKLSADTGHTFSSAPKGKGDFLLYLDNPELAGTLDAVSAMMVLHYVPPWKLPQAMEHIWASLCEGGLFIGMVKKQPDQLGEFIPGRSLYPTYSGFAQGIVLDMLLQHKYARRGTENGIVIDAYTPDALKAMLQVFGFDVQICSSFKETCAHPNNPNHNFEYVGFIVKKRAVAEPSADKERYVVEGEKLKEPLFKRFKRAGIPIPQEWL